MSGNLEPGPNAFDFVKYDLADPASLERLGQVIKAASEGLEEGENSLSAEAFNSFCDMLSAHEAAFDIAKLYIPSLGNGSLRHKPANKRVALLRSSTRHFGKAVASELGNPDSRPSDLWGNRGSHRGISPSSSLAVGDTRPHQYPFGPTSSTPTTIFEPANLADELARGDLNTEPKVQRRTGKPADVYKGAGPRRSERIAYNALADIQFAGPLEVDTAKNVKEDFPDLAQGLSRQAPPKTLKSRGGGARTTRRPESTIPQPEADTIILGYGD